MMTRRQRQLISAALATIPLTLGLTAPHAQATVDGLYDCQHVIYIDFVINKPVNGWDCTGPVGTAPPGSVDEIPTGRSYSCQNLKGTIIDGSLHVHGDFCEPF